ncbi:hydrogenase maturation nickel metallochaperone HypA [Methanotorris formicicus]|uniref:Hydrogenase maturation factor HypA n=1 Tax=Methanotorris formicicus Mc-S-70 TaxID=647171 RepID=H1L057_9EURY|nr:hydrogenase maturation nickel metallochaperone HypA [Methanotorris formicicus]EHP85191.1 hydrogenase nickel insertion protein HypA [Methanotorris formicicus Mc-S-70]
MHELSYATSILDTILNTVKEQEKDGKKVKKVSEINLEVGKLTFINIEQLKFAFEVIAEGTICENAKINVKFIKPLAVCRDCGYVGDIKAEDEFEIYCPKCNSMNLKFKGGKEFNIKNIVVEFED